MELLLTLVGWIVQAVSHWGYPGNVVMMFLESSFFPFPSEVVVPPAGYLATRGEMSMGLGHATRTLPVIRHFLEKHWRVSVLAHDNALHFLEQDLAGNDITYIEHEDYPKLERGTGLAFFCNLLIDLVRTTLLIRKKRESKYNYCKRIVMNKVIKTLLQPLPAVLLAAGFFLVPATSFASMQDEINHLLNYIETSDCVFIRNNSHHTSDKAVEHIKKKYNYLKKRIKTTDDFIKGAASKSSMSGKAYMSICGGRKMATADWLRAELQRYRLQNSAGSSLQKEERLDETDVQPE